jgi:hypothetical protein
LSSIATVGVGPVCACEHGPAVNVNANACESYVHRPVALMNFLGPRASDRCCLAPDTRPARRPVTGLENELGSPGRQLARPGGLEDELDFAGRLSARPVGLEDLIGSRAGDGVVHHCHSRPGGHFNELSSTPRVSYPPG